ncbi:GTPase HflX [Candidatus Margulisiibacteriota bacterium]
MFDSKKALLVGIELQRPIIPLAESLAELKRLADTAGYEVVGELTQKRQKPDRRYFLGIGKLEELKALIAEKDANLVIFDVELLPSQQRNLEESFEDEVNVIDRTALIINIFAKHAHSREGKIQAELASMEYEMPRLSGKWEHLSRQRGGTGLRDVGEKQIELDRRMVRKRITLLKKDIEKIRMDRHLRRENRKRGNLPVISLVGYTNSGKSTLLNALTKADVLTQDQLFATLDPTTRRTYLPNGKTVLLTDTVGFIQKLPHQLVVAFRATLEEVTEADLLLHVVDASHPCFEDQISAVYTVLEELKCATKPMVTVFNKIDKLAEPINDKILQKYKPAIAISALNLATDSLGDKSELFHQLAECLRL